MSTIYQYPSAKDKQLARREMPKRLAARKKLLRRLYLSVAVSVVIAVIAVFSHNVAATVLLLLLSAISLLVSVVAVRISLVSFETEETVIYDDYKLIHTTALMKGGKRRFEIKLTDALKSYQDSVGNLVFELSDKSSASVTDIKKKKEIARKSERTVTVIIRTTKTKLFLINELYEIIHYPKKSYNVIEDDDFDEDGFEKNWSDRI